MMRYIVRACKPSRYSRKKTSYGYTVYEGESFKEARQTLLKFSTFTSVIFESKEVEADEPHDRDVRCWFCGGKLVWDSDFNYDEVHGEGGGIVAYLHCSECGAVNECSLRDDEE